MKVLLLTSVALFVLCLSSCSKTEAVVTLHPTTEIDIDENGTIDYRIRFSEVDIEPITFSGGTFGVAGRLTTVGENEILRKLQEPSLFLRDLDQVEEDVETPLQWRSVFSQTIVSIATATAEGDWPAEWDVNSDTEHSSYFLGLKLVSDNQFKLGWLAIEIDRSNGVVTVVDKGLL